MTGVFKTLCWYSCTTCICFNNQQVIVCVQNIELTAVRPSYGMSLELILVRNCPYDISYLLTYRQTHTPADTHDL